MFAVEWSSMKRERIDKLLVDRGLAHSRTKAQALVMAGVVLIDEQLVNKPSEAFAPDANIRLKGVGDAASRYVSRGGLKLEAALGEFQIITDELICLDIGASTGGFTDCLLQHGARRVVAVDVGHNQFDWRLRNDPRVELRGRPRPSLSTYPSSGRSQCAEFYHHSTSVLRHGVVDPSD